MTRRRGGRRGKNEITLSGPMMLLILGVFLFSIGALDTVIGGVGDFIDDFIPPITPPGGGGGGGGDPPPPNTLSLYDAVKDGGTVALSGNYYVDRQITVSSSLSLTGSANIVSTADFTGYALIIQGTPLTSIAVNIPSGIRFDFAERTAGIKIQYANNVRLGCTVENTVKRGPNTYVDGIDVKNSRNIVCDGLTINNVQFSGISFANCDGIEVKNGRFDHNAQLYVGGGSIHMDVGCSDIWIHHNTITGDSMNDAIYCGQSTSPASGGVVIEYNNIDVNELPGGTYMGSGIKTYTINAVVQNNNVDMTHNAFGISDWGSGTRILYNVVNDCYVGIKSPNTMTGNTVTNCFRSYEYY